MPNKFIQTEARLDSGVGHLKKGVGMSPDQMKAALTMRFPELKAEARENPDGWAFFLGAPRRGVNSNRIVRATRAGPAAATRLKCCISSRISDRDVELEFAGSEAELQALVAEEIRLYQERFAK